MEKVGFKNIITGHVVKKENSNEILNARKIGKDATELFYRERIIDQTIPFLNPVKKLNFRSFSTENKKLKVSNKSEPVPILQHHNHLFSQLLTVSNQREIDLPTILGHELFAVPLSLFHPTGEMRKTNKSQLLKELENECCSKEFLPDHLKQTCATIVDFMALVQSINKAGLQTFDHLSERLQFAVLSKHRESDVCVLVPDCYDIEDSIKSDKRLRRKGDQEVRKVDIKTGLTKLPKQLTNYLSSSKNKTNLINFMYNQ